MPKIIIELDDNLYSSIVNHRAKIKYQEHLDYEDLKNAVEDAKMIDECEDCISRTMAKEKKVYSEFRHEYVIPVAEIDWLPRVYPKGECKAEDCINRKDFLETCKKYCDIHCDYLPAQRQFMCSSCMMGDAIMFAEDALSVYPKSEDYIKANEQLKKQIEMLKLDRDCQVTALKELKEKINRIMEKNTNIIDGTVLIDFIDRCISGEE